MSDGFLFDVRVLELGDEKGEFCGKLFAGAGADVIKIEPPGGGPTREIGPFYHDQPHPDRSLYFWHYNLGKRGVTLDYQDAARATTMLRKLIAQNDGSHRQPAARHAGKSGPGLGRAAKAQSGPGLCADHPIRAQRPMARSARRSDLVHLALGGEMMLCGYDPKPDGTYDTPPIAPQMWHAYHIAGNQAFIAAVGALIARRYRRGRHDRRPGASGGQRLHRS